MPHVWQQSKNTPPESRKPSRHSSFSVSCPARMIVDGSSSRPAVGDPTGPAVTSGGTLSLPTRRQRSHSAPTQHEPPPHSSSQPGLHVPTVSGGMKLSQYQGYGGPPP